MKRYAVTIFLLAATTIYSGSAQAISITQNSDATALANAIIGPGITLVGTPTLTGAAVQSGTFTGGAVNVGISDGVVLSSGDVNQIPGANSSTPETLGSGGTGSNTTSTDLAGAGDPRLTALSGNPTFDAVVLTFQFQFGDGAAGGNVGVRYAFASEEYLDYVNSQFNDVFGFFVDGVNIALTPGTGDPVAVNTINPLKNSACYINNVDNTDGLPVANVGITLDGLTCVLTAQALGLAAGTHTMAFAIADASDGVLDSAVFLEAGSFNPSTGSVPEPSTVLLLGLGLAGLGLMERARRGRS